MAREWGSSGVSSWLSTAGARSCAGASASAMAIPKGASFDPLEKLMVPPAAPLPRLPHASARPRLARAALPLAACSE